MVPAAPGASREAIEATSVKVAATFSRAGWMVDNVSPRVRHGLLRPPDVIGELSADRARQSCESLPSINLLLPRHAFIL